MAVLNCFYRLSNYSSGLCWLFELLLHVSDTYSIIDFHYSYSLLLASHSLRSISLGSTTSSLRSKSTTRIFVYSSSKYCFFSSAGGFFPFGFVFDFLQRRRKEDRLRSCK